MLNFNLLILMRSPFNFIKERLENLEISTKETAEKIVNLIPNTCPFAREIRLFNRSIFKIPPLCKLNPFYEDLMMLRFRALSFLCEIGEDITPYCQ
ncbi:Mo-dependent nitrogenase C-terminal domain-containing protein [Cyanobacterium aponinum UTEX 3221]|uniref:Mo-dependent nitrogenase family protein n=2 Tax=Cyanobacterium aponinum TaxID=379064 RepID=K9Z2K9_CYAAP|nr:Mo-dependent nitrogenase C-terminal domain-containing protein [Cyanobacterium aponinum]AFZ53436.1 Mo-dependent nitrogenase family protein [Cyanobacterium aponinum PCC 10605]MBD2393307.1 Mo-dependent nitrogenase C-terminal domain-containing protein [Cyanobacterium aponinum FACHB-4101]MTF38557.1 Mo-dependent nitrogenase [Cyanobacterium aponinum 0216]PHV61763.1 Mo-dependent nitrogenase [Cyanobacterium aponinum IPPAS B-1201]WRL37828.1 Mo-dependent nitrogenase C-terminal domain-containing protei